jgi:hypothetical protein
MTELTVADVKGLMSRFTYKPDYRFGVVERSGELVIQGYMDTIDSRSKLGKVTIDACRSVIPETVLKGGEDAFWQWLHDAVIAFLEHHEMDEWFQVDGKLLSDPHSEPQWQGVFRAIANEWRPEWTDVTQHVRVCRCVNAPMRPFTG